MKWRLAQPPRSKACSTPRDLRYALAEADASFKSAIQARGTDEMARSNGRERGSGWAYQVGHQTTRPALPRGAAVLQPPSGRTPSTPPTGWTPGAITRAHQAAHWAPAPWAAQAPPQANITLEVV